MARSAKPTVPLLHALLAQGEANPTFDSLAHIAGISQRSVANKVSEMRQVQAVVGRRPVLLGPGLGLALAISCTAETVRAGLVDANGALWHPVEEEPEPELLRQPPSRLFRRLRAAGARVLASALADPELCAEGGSSLRLLGLVVAWPSPLVHLGQQTNRPPTPPSWMRADGDGHAISVADRVGTEFGGPFIQGRSHVLSDIHAQALCIAFDDSRSRAVQRDATEQAIAVVVQVDERISAATLALPPSTPQRLSFIEARLVSGGGGGAGELGHIPVSERLIADCNRRSPFAELAPLDYDAAVCSCGIRGHLEAFASSTALAARLRASGYRRSAQEPGPDSVISSRFEEEMDPAQLQAVHDIGRILGSSMAGPVAMLDPDRITLTGPLASRPLLEGFVRERDHWGLAALNAQVTIVDRPQRAFVGVRGAGLSLIRHSVYRRFEQGVDQIRMGAFDFGPADLSILEEKVP